MLRQTAAASVTISASTASSPAGRTAADRSQIDVPGGAAEVGEPEADEPARMVGTTGGEHARHEAARGVGHREERRRRRVDHAGSDGTADVVGVGPRLEGPHQHRDPGRGTPAPPVDRLVESSLAADA